MELLRERPLTVGEIATRLELRQPQASKHLRVLQGAGLIEVRPQANRRLCALRPEGFRDLDDWLRAYRQLWEARYDRLDNYLQTLQPSADTDPQTPISPPEELP